MPLKGAADGLGIILQVHVAFSFVYKQIIESSCRTDDFLFQLERIEYQAARVAENPNFDRMSPSKRNFMRERGIHLITAIIKFLDSALAYFSQGFLGT